MTKILLVEDDKSLREIYGVRLLAEGYDIVTASDGEEALAIAIKEHPALIIADVMMPKISGFDMLDILKSTTETRNIKVIVMTALSSDEQRERGERIGADRYLVKSQVGIEDVVKTVHEVLGDKPEQAAASTPTQQNAAPTMAPAVAPVQPVVQPQANSVQAPAQQVTPAAAPDSQSTWQPPTPKPQQSVTSPASASTLPAWQPPVAPDPQQPVASAPQPYTRPAQPASYTMPAALSTTPARPASKQRIIQPINDPSQRVDINELLNRELAKEAGLPLDQLSQTTAQERQFVNNQIQQAQTVPAQSQQQASEPSPAPAVTQQPQPVTDQQAPMQNQPIMPTQQTPVQQAPAPTSQQPFASSQTNSGERATIGQAPARDITPPTR